VSDFQPAYEAMIRNEGGYVLHKVAGDRGGMTYAGIARNMHPDWGGWSVIDTGGEPHAGRVRSFYRTKFWTPIRGDDIEHQAIAQAIFDFGVNTGIRVASQLAQLVVGATPDGKIGPATLALLNAYEPDRFVTTYALAKIARYRDIVTRDRTQQKFLLGWINRTLVGTA
jgi:lysozyme family protein